MPLEFSKNAYDEEGKKRDDIELVDPSSQIFTVDYDVETSNFGQSISNVVDSSNIGFKMLQKFGWKGHGLGKSEQGITVPVMVVQTDCTLGIGKATEYEKYLVEVTRDRKKMDVEIDQTVDIIQKKREATDRQECVENDLKRITQEFYCESCDKRYKNVSEMSNHLSSYDHHHKKRFKEMKDVAKRRKRGFAIGESDEARKEEIRRKEEKREAKEMENRINKARAMQQSSSTSAPAASSSSSSTGVLPPLYTMQSPPLPPFEQPLSQSLSGRTDIPRPPPPIPLPAPLGNASSPLEHSSPSSLTYSHSSKPSLMPFTASHPQPAASVASSSSYDSVIAPPPPSQPVKPIVMKFNFAMKKK